MLQQNEQSNVIARAADQSDFSAIITLWQRLMTEEEDAVDRIEDLDMALQKWSWRLGKQIQERKAFVVQYHKKIVGFVCYIGRVKDKSHERDQEQELQDINSRQLKRLPVPPGIAYVTDIYVSPEARRSRAARSLIITLLEAVADAGYTAIWTNTSSRNRRVQILLQRLGFSVLNGFKIPGKENHIYYEKKLTGEAMTSTLKKGPEDPM